MQSKGKGEARQKRKGRREERGNPLDLEFDFSFGARWLHAVAVACVVD